MMVAQVVNHGKMFDDCSSTNKWEWISVNISLIGLVSWRCEKQVGHSHSVCMCGLKLVFVKLLCNPKQ